MTNQEFVEITNQILNNIYSNNALNKIPILYAYLNDITDDTSIYDINIIIQRTFEGSVDLSKLNLSK